MKPVDYEKQLNEIDAQVNDLFYDEEYFKLANSRIHNKNTTKRIQGSATRKPERSKNCNFPYKLVVEKLM